MSPPHSVWHLLNMPCRGTSRLASESLDRDLGRLERIALRTHLLCCRGCRRYAGQVALLSSALGRVSANLASGQDSPGPPLPDDVRERIKDALRDQ